MSTAPFRAEECPQAPRAAPRAPGRPPNLPRAGRGGNSSTTKHQPNSKQQQETQSRPVKSLLFLVFPKYKTHQPNIVRTEGPVCVAAASLTAASRHTWLATGHGLGRGNLVEKSLSYNKIGNLVFLSSIPSSLPPQIECFTFCYEARAHFSTPRCSGSP